MTITYTAEVTTSRGFSCFLKLLRRWRGSIYQLIWKELIIFLVAYYFINFIYRFALTTNDQLRNFERIVKYCERYYNLIPLSFILGFYVNIVMTRWWSQFITIPCTDNLALLVSASIQSDDDRGRIIRRTIMRYVSLSFVITLTLISPKVKKRFPTLNHLVEAGLLEQDELTIINDFNEEYPDYSKQWMPLAWASNVVTRAQKEGLIRDDFSVKALLTEICQFRGKCGTLLDYDWISVPLVYTQVVTLAVYSYFLTTLFAFQMVDTEDRDDLYFPILAVLEFIFYMGWLKVAEVLINPFGDDEDDFDVVWMVDRNIQVSYLIVDKMHHKHPKLMKDQYWENIAPKSLPHTKASCAFMRDSPVSSTSKISVKNKDAETFLPKNYEDLDGLRNRQSSKWVPKIFSSHSFTDHEVDMRSVSTSNNNAKKISRNIKLSASNNENTSNMSEFLDLKKQRQTQKQQKLMKLLNIKTSTDDIKE